MPIGPILREFKESLVSVFGEGFSSLTLYGSFAREESRIGSDVDLLLVLKDEFYNPVEDESKLIPLISKFLLDHGYLISIIVKSKSELASQKEGLMKNIEVEGIAI